MLFAGLSTLLFIKPFKPDTSMKGYLITLVIVIVGVIVADIVKKKVLKTA